MKFFNSLYPANSELDTGVEKFFSLYDENSDGLIDIDEFNF